MSICLPLESFPLLHNLPFSFIHKVNEAIWCSLGNIGIHAEKEIITLFSLPSICNTEEILPFFEHHFQNGRSAKWENMAIYRVVIRIKKNKINGFTKKKKPNILKVSDRNL